VTEIKTIIIPQITPIAKLIVKRSEGYLSIIQTLLPVVQRMLLDPVLEVSENAAGALANLAELLTNEDRGNHILTIVLSKRD
jgi:hypothetical protein